MFDIKSLCLIVFHSFLIVHAQEECDWLAWESVVSLSLKPAPPQVQNYFLKDINEDGEIDLVYLNPGQNAIESIMWYNAAEDESHRIDRIYGTEVIHGVEDFTGDNDEDLILFHPDNGSISFTSHAPPFIASDWSIKDNLASNLEPLKDAAPEAVVFGQFFAGVQARMHLAASFRSENEQTTIVLENKSGLSRLEYSSVYCDRLLVMKSSAIERLPESVKSAVNDVLVCVSVVAQALRVYFRVLYDTGTSFTSLASYSQIQIPEGASLQSYAELNSMVAMGDGRIVGVTTTPGQFTSTYEVYSIDMNDIGEISAVVVYGIQVTNNFEAPPTIFADSADQIVSVYGGLHYFEWDKDELKAKESRYVNGFNVQSVSSARFARVSNQEVVAFVDAHSTKTLQFIRRVLECSLASTTTTSAFPSVTSSAVTSTSDQVPPPVPSSSSFVSSPHTGTTTTPSTATETPQVGTVSVTPDESMTQSDALDGDNLGADQIALIIVACIAVVLFCTLLIIVCVWLSKRRASRSSAVAAQHAQEMNAMAAQPAPVRSRQSSKVAVRRARSSRSMRSAPRSRAMTHRRSRAPTLRSVDPTQSTSKSTSVHASMAVGEVGRHYDLAPSAPSSGPYASIRQWTASPNNNPNTMFSPMQPSGGSSEYEMISAIRDHGYARGALAAGRSEGSQYARAQYSKFTGSSNSQNDNHYEQLELRKQ